MGDQSGRNFSPLRRRMTIERTKKLWPRETQEGWRKGHVMGRLLMKKDDEWVSSNVSVINNVFYLCCEKFEAKIFCSPDQISCRESSDIWRSVFEALWELSSKYQWEQVRENVCVGGKGGCEVVSLGPILIRCGSHFALQVVALLLRQLFWFH